MDCLTKSKTNSAEKTYVQDGNPEDKTPKKITNKEGGIAPGKMQLYLGKKKILDVNSPEFEPLKHYLNTLYGLPEIDPDSKIVCIIEPTEEFFISQAARNGGHKSEVDCWHVHRRCYAWSFSVGTLILLLGLTCLLMGFLMPRHSALVNSPIGNNEEMGTIAPSNNNDSAIPNRKAIEHNNLLDTLKLSGGMASCFGCLLLLMTFILPPGSHPPKELDEEEQQAVHLNQLNEALRNCGF